MTGAPTGESNVWKKLVVGIAGVLVLAFTGITLRPSSFRVERSVFIAAPVDVVYDQIASLRSMDGWSPYAQLDPDMEISYAGAEAGVGARSAWDGPRMGRGRLTITNARPNERIEMRLEMFAPLRATNQVVFELAPSDSGTCVRWRMDGKNGFVGKAIGLVMDVDAMVGGQFESGLASLARLAEARASGRPLAQAR